MAKNLLLMGAIEGIRRLRVAPALRACFAPLARLLSRVARFLEFHSVALTPEQIGLVEGVRAAAAVALMVAIACWAHLPILGWAAFGAFWTCLADPGGSGRERLLAMGGFAVAGTVIAPLSATVAGLGSPFAAALLFVLVLVCFLSRVWGPGAAQAGVLAAVVAVVAVSYPRSPLESLELGGVFLAGCAWALVLCLVLWRTHPHDPARRAVSAIYTRLEDMRFALTLPVREKALHARAAAHRRSVRNAIERAHGMLARPPGDAGHGYLAAGLDVAEQSFAALIAIDHYTHGGVPEADRQDYSRTMAALKQMLAELRHQSGCRRPDGRKLAALAEWMAAGPEAGGRFFSEVMLQSVAALHAAARQWPPEAVAPARKARQAAGQMRAERRLTRRIGRHALRAAIAVVLAYAAAQALGLAESYWATMATVVVLQPAASATWRRSAERILGSIGGGLIAALGAALLAAPAGLLLAIFPVAAAAIALRFVNYTLFVMFLTPLFIFVAELLQPGHGLAWARATDNVVGSLIGAGAGLLWPEQVKHEMGQVLAKAVAANLAYAEIVTRDAGRHDGEILGARRAAGIESTAAETCRQRLTLEGRRSSAHLDEAAAVLTALRDLAGMVTVARLAGSGGEDGHSRNKDVQRLKAWADFGPGDASASKSADDDFSRSMHGLDDALAAYRAAI